MRRRRVASFVLCGVLAAGLLTGCGGDSTDSASADDSPAAPPAPSVSESSSATVTGSPSSTPEPSGTPPPVEVDARELLVQRDQGGTGHWQEDEADTAEQPEFTNAPKCTALNVDLFRVENSEDEAAVGWFNPRTINVMNSGQVVRVYPSVNVADAALDDLVSTVRGCGSWREGIKPPGSWLHRASLWEAPGLPGTAFAWRVQVGIDGVSKKHNASTWYITARYGNVVNTVASTSMDDVATKAQSDVRIYANQAGRSILASQGR